MFLSTLAIAQSSLLGGRDFCDAGSGCHGYLCGCTLRQHEGPGMHRGEQPGGAQRDGENRRISGELKDTKYRYTRKLRVIINSAGPGHAAA